MEREQLLAAIAAQEQLRGLVADEVIDATIATLRAQLEEESSLQQRRRQVTVLFADVTGFTAMSESLDAEVVAGLMNDVWTQLDRVVVDHGGRVDKHIGDALMAVWGADVTAEDDAERAVRAALGLQSELEQFRVRSGRDVGMRVGVNTGPVLVGPVGSTHELTVMGDTVNTASRLEHAAPPGGVLMSHDTYRQVRGVFDVEALEPLAVKGKVEPLRVYLAKLEKARAFRLGNRGVEGVETSIVGRDSEFAALCEAFEEVNRTGHGQSVVVEGEAGVGKSRLLYEFDNWLELHEESVFYFKARATRARSESRLGLWRDLLASRAGVTDGDPASAVLEKLSAETHGVLDDRETMILGLWLGFEPPESSEGSWFVSGENLATAGKAHLWAYFRSLLVDSTVLILFEDLHWADAASRELLGELVSQFSGERLLVVAATRPQHEAAPATATPDPAWQTISLDSLDETASRALVVEILKRVDELPEPLVELVVERAGGNPFFIEELVKKLIDDGCIVTDAVATQWTVDAGRLDEAAIPRTLTGVLQSRFEVLSEDGRRSLQRAAIVGRTFWDSAVEALGPEPIDLDQPVKNELVFPRRPSAFTETSEFTFKHALLHDVAYDTVLLSERPILHRRAARWLTEVVGERREEYLEEIAGHLLLAEENDHAAKLLVEAAGRALNSGDASSALRLAEAGFDTGKAAAADRRGHLILATACRLLGDLNTAQEEADREIQLAEAAGDDAAVMAAIHEAFVVSETQGANERGRELVRHGLPLAERLGGTSLTQMLACSAWSELNAGEFDAARQAAAATLELAESQGDPEILVEAHKINGTLASTAGSYDEASYHDQRVLELAVESGDLKEVAVGHLNNGVNLHRQADFTRDETHYDRAQAAYEEALVMTRRLGFRAYEAQVLGNLAQLRIRRGQLAAGQALAKESLALATSIGLHAHALFTVLIHAEATFEATGNAEALTHIGSVSSDPALGRVAAEVSEVVERLRTSHPDVDVDNYLETGASLVFDEVVTYILESPSS